MMSEELTKLLEAARDHKMSPDERREQAISFVYGNLHIENPNVTREMVADAYDRLRLTTSTHHIHVWGALKAIPPDGEMGRECRGCLEYQLGS